MRIIKHAECIFSIGKDGKTIYSQDRDISVINGMVNFSSNEINISSTILETVIFDATTEITYTSQNMFTGGLKNSEENKQGNDDSIEITLQTLFIRKLTELGYFSKAGCGGSVIINNNCNVQGAENGQGLTALDEFLIDYETLNFEFKPSVNKEQVSTSEMCSDLLSIYSEETSEITYGNYKAEIYKRKLEIDINSSKNFWKDLNPVIYLERYRPIRISSKKYDIERGWQRDYFTKTSGFVRENLNTYNHFNRVNKFVYADIPLIDNKLTLDIRPETYFEHRVRLQWNGNYISANIPEVRPIGRRKKMFKQAQQTMRFCLEITFEEKIYRVYSQVFNLVLNTNINYNSADFRHSIRYIDTNGSNGRKRIEATA